MANTIKNVTLFLTTKEVKTKDATGKEKKFTAYKTQIGKLNLDVKFTKEYDGVKPIKDGYFKISADKLSLDTSKDYPCLWIR